MIKKYSNILLSVTLALAVTCALYLACGANLLGSSFLDKQAHWLSFFLFGLTLLFGSTVIFFGYRLNRYKPSLILATIFVALFLINLVNLFFYNNPTTYDFVDPLNNIYSINYSISGIDLAIYALRFFGMLFAAYLVFDFTPKFYKTNHILKIVLWGILIFAAIAIIYSFFAESIKYYYLITFDNFFIRLHTLAIYSFFGSKNSFGTIMLMALIASIFLFKEKKNPWWLIALFISNVWLVLSQCKMGLMAGFIVEVAYFISLYVSTFKDNKKRNSIIGVSILGGLLLTIGLLLVVTPSREFIYKIFSNLFQEANGMNTFESRQVIWSYSFNILSHSNYVTGVGFGLFDDILFAFTSVDRENAIMYHMTTTHNVYLQMIANGGIILLLIWLSLVAYFIYASIKVFKLNKEISITSLILTGSLLLYGIFESSCMIFVQTGEFIVLTFLTMFPVLQLKNQNKDLANDRILKLL